VVDKLAEATMPKVEGWLAKRAGNTNNCTLENAAVRREWNDLSVAERKEYIRAVLCLQSKPSKAPKDQVPESLSRYDDFVATHMTMAPMLHSPTNLFAAHRYFIYSYEKELREQCGYKGYQPVSTGLLYHLLRHRDIL
jgi:tyrosinase